jgi:periplasmic protein TonB
VPLLLALSLQPVQVGRGLHPKVHKRSSKGAPTLHSQFMPAAAKEQSRDASTSSILSVYRLPSPYERQPLRRRLSSFALALAINLVLVAMLIELGILPPPAARNTKGLVVDLISPSSSPSPSQRSNPRQRQVVEQKPVPKPPPIILPVKPTITPPRHSKSAPFVEMSRDEMAASDISRLPAAGGGSAGDSEAVGRGPNGELLYSAEWAREPTNAELGGYLPRNAPDGFGLVACKTIPNDRVEDCVELDQTPGSHLAAAVRQAAWQFRVRPPRKGGHALVGSWVQIRIDYYRSGSD